MIDMTYFLAPEILERLKDHCKRTDQIPLSEYPKHLQRAYYIQRVFKNIFEEGPKMVRLDTNLFDKFAEMQLRVPIQHYQQPYKTIIVEFSNIDFGGWSSTFYGLTSVIEGKIAVLFYYDRHKCKDKQLSGPGRLDKIIEATWPTEEAECVHHFINATLAVNLFMVYAGTTLGEYVKPDDYRRAKRSKRFMERQIQYIHCEQFIKLMRKRTGGGKSTGEGGQKRPHWRGGYMRMQPYGPGRTFRRPQYIDEVFVNKHLFGGDLGDTEVTYHP